MATWFADKTKQCTIIFFTLLYCRFLILTNLFTQGLFIKHSLGVYCGPGNRPNTEEAKMNQTHSLPTHSWESRVEKTQLLTGVISSVTESYMQDARWPIMECSSLRRASQRQLKFLNNDRKVIEEICLRKKVYCRKRKLNVQSPEVWTSLVGLGKSRYEDRLWQLGCGEGVKGWDYGAHTGLEAEV